MTTPGLVVDRHTTLLGEATATFSPDRAYRYALTRRWATAGPVTVFVMLNPSTADALTDDPTIRRCIGFARRWGSTGLLVINAFGLRSTDPTTLDSHPDPVGPDNDVVITTELAGHPVDRVVAAWGTYRRMRGRACELTALLAPLGHRLLCLGTTKAGHPRHPLYLPGGTPLVPLEETRR